MPYHRPEAIANYFLSLPGGLGRLTQMQIQKLVYIAHGWNLYINNQPLVGNEPEAWDRGPVFPDLRDHIKLAGAKPLESLIHEGDDNPFAFLGGGDRGEIYSADLTERERQVLDQVWSRYGRMGAFKLSDLTHLPDTPWSQAYYGDGRNAVIPNERIRHHYADLATRAQQYSR